MNKNLDEFKPIFEKYRMDFKHKAFPDYNGDTDALMNIFGITPSTKNQNMQYWGRQLGACWESIVIEICKRKSPGFKTGLVMNRKQVCDLIAGKYAIDTKYRIGSGDSGTVNKFKDNAKQLISKGYEPILLILRTDNLQSTISQCESSGWIVYTGEKTFCFIRKIAGGFDMKRFLSDRAGAYHISAS